MLNSTASFVWEHCDGRTSADEIAKRLSEQIKTPVENSLICFTLEKLSKRGLLSSYDENCNSSATGLSRRELIKRIGFASAGLLPVISNVAAPVASQAQSCLAPNTPVPDRPATNFPKSQACSNYCLNPSNFTQCCSGAGIGGTIYVFATGSCTCAASRCA
ncbi:MAG: PqqD family protein [Pyrinomonadaceae bacterium]|nr:PqqD family protein [Pyrinomonadaceae bacterium]